MMSGIRQIAIKIYLLTLVSITFTFVKPNFASAFTKHCEILFELPDHMQFEANRTRHQVNTNLDYEYKRPWISYVEKFPLLWDLFFRKSVPAQTTWINIGGGSFLAERDFLLYVATAHVRVVSVNVQTPRDNWANAIEDLLTHYKKEDRFKILEGRRVREIPNEQLRSPDVQRVILTDLFSAMAYSDRPDLELEKYSQLTRDGDYVFFAISEHANFGLRDSRLGSAGASPLAKTREGAYSLYSDDITDYLRTLRGFEVAEKKRFDKDGLAIALRRTSEEFFAPPLTPDTLVTSTPPLRGFLWNKEAYYKKPLWKFW